MGEIPGNSVTQSKINAVTPLTKCDDGFTVIFTLESGKYSCLLQDTANLWINQGIAEKHDPQSYVLDKIQDKDVSVTIIGINQKLQEFDNELALKQAELKKNYDKKYATASEKLRDDEKNAIKDHSERPGMSKEELSTKIIQIRKKYDSTQDSILQEKMESLKLLDNTHKENVKKFADAYVIDPYVKIVWNSDMSRYEVIKKN